MSSEAFLNAFLAEFLVNRFENSQTGNAESLPAGAHVQGSGKAERLGAWIRERITIPVCET